jgi:hypothetical protein
MSEKAIGHPEDDQIEEYVLGRMGPPATPAVMRLESHLLSCPRCIVRAEEALDFVRVVREMFALGDFGRHPVVGQRRSDTIRDQALLES